MWRSFFSTVAGKRAVKSPLTPFDSPYMKNVVNKAQFGPLKEKPTAESLRDFKEIDELQCDDEKQSEIPAADHFWTAKVNANIERLQDAKKSDGEVIEDNLTKKHTTTSEPTTLNAAKKTIPVKSYGDDLHEAIAGKTGHDFKTFPTLRPFFSRYNEHDSGYASRPQSATTKDDQRKDVEAGDVCI